MYVETQKEQAMIEKDEERKIEFKASLHEMIAIRRAANSYLPHY